MAESKDGDWEQIRPLLTGLEQRTNQARFWYALPDGSYYTTVDNLTTANLASPPYFPGVLAGNTSIGSVVVSHSTGRTTGIVAVPIFDTTGNVTGVLGSSVYLDLLSSDLTQSLPLPETMYFFALDRDGLTTLHSRSDQIGRQMTTQGTPEGIKAVRTMMSQDEGQVTFLSGGVQQNVIPARRNWVWAALIGFVSAAIVGLVGLVTRRRDLNYSSRALGRTGLFFWITYLPISMWAMQTTGTACSWQSRAGAWH